MQWISVGAELPPHDVPVLVCYIDAEIEPEIDFLVHCSESGEDYFANDPENVVTHWCVIPAHPNSQ